MQSFCCFLKSYLVTSYHALPTVSVYSNSSKSTHHYSWLSSRLRETIMGINTWEVLSRDAQANNTGTRRCCIKLVQVMPARSSARAADAYRLAIMFDNGRSTLHNGFRDLLLVTYMGGAGILGAIEKIADAQSQQAIALAWKIWRCPQASRRHVRGLRETGVYCRSVRGHHSATTHHRLRLHGLTQGDEAVAPLPI